MDAIAIKQAYRLSEIIGKDIRLEKNGREYKAPCPFHNEKTASFTINDDKGFYHCFGCSAHGSVIDYIMHSRNVEFTEACKILDNDINIAIPTIKKDLSKERFDLYKDYIPIFPVPEYAPQIFSRKNTPPIYRPKKELGRRIKIYTSEMVHDVCAIKDTNGQLIGYEFRLILPDKPKIPMVVTWCKRPEDQGTEGWTIRTFDNPRPLYGQERLKEKGQVLIVEGLPKVDAVNEITQKFIPISWLGGAGGYKYANWPLLKGRNIIIWPDADEVGIKAANNIAELLTELGVEQIKILIPPENAPKGWDAVDAFKRPANGEKPWDYKKFIEWAKKSAIVYNPAKITHNEKTQEEITHIKEEPKKEEKKPKRKAITTFADEPFHILGYNNGLHYYISRKRPRIIGLTSSQHTRGHLFELVPDIAWWQNKFMGENGIKWDAVACALINAAQSAGFFMGHFRRRGRGAWIDEGRKIFHIGDKLLVDGISTSLLDIESEYVYEEDDPIRLPNLQSLPISDAQKLIKICESLEWDNKLSGKLLAGWCVIAPICGMLEWRPHIWITGAPDSGKSFSMNFIIRNMMQLFSYSVDGGTTEAAIKRRLRKDAKPVIFDEAEAKGQRAASMMESILFYIRKASSGSLMEMVRPDGEVETFIIRSCFCLSSIDTNIEDEADDTRITQLNLRKSFIDPQELYNKFNALKDLAITTFTPEYSSGMMMRAFNNIEVLLDNIKTFQEAAMDTFSQGRHALQLAPMLAGAYLCHSNNRISLQDAKNWIAGNDWQDILPQEAEKDCDKLFGLIMAYKMRLVDGNKMIQKNIGQMILAISRYQDNYTYYNEELKQMGIEVINNEDAIYIANQSPQINNILKDTPWHRKKWSRTLKRISGSKPVDGRYWSPAIKNGTRGISIPLAFIREEKINIATQGEEVEEIGFDD
jgi:putative DNA primase/helicase